MKEEKLYNYYTGDVYHDMSISPKPEQWGIIRHCYQERMHSIISAAQAGLNNWIDINFIDWNNHFSPIEKIVWSSIRSKPNLVLYPQYPLFNHFIDFANPALKIGLELDGKEFHDELQDEARDRMFLKYGWKIFRANGSLSHHDKEDYEEFKDLYEYDFEDPVFYRRYEDWMTSTVTGLLDAIRIYYFYQPHDQRINNIIMTTLQCRSFTRSKLLDISKLNRPF